MPTMTSHITNRKKLLIVILILILLFISIRIIYLSILEKVPSDILNRIDVSKFYNFYPKLGQLGYDIAKENEEIIELNKRISSNNEFERGYIYITINKEHINNKNLSKYKNGITYSRQNMLDRHTNEVTLIHTHMMKIENEAIEIFIVLYSNNKSNKIMYTELTELLDFLDLQSIKAN